MIQPASAAFRPGHLLLVEDDAGLADLFQQGLVGCGLEFARIESGRAALQWIAAHPDCLLLLDYSLPDMTAQALIETLRQSDAVPPFLVITGHGDERVAVSMMKLGARDYLVKDAFLLERLGSIVERVLHEIETERRLMETEGRHRLLIENAPHCIHEIDLAGHLLSMSPAGLRMLGVQDEVAIRGRPYLDTVSEQDREGVWSYFQKALLGEGSEFDFQASNGRFFRSSFVPIRNHHGKVLRVMGLTQDVTASRLAEEELQRSRVEWENIFQAIGQPTVVLDPEHGLIAANQAFLKAVGKTLEEVRGLKCWQLFHGPGVIGPIPGCPMEASLEKGCQQSFECRMEVLKAECLVSCTPIRNASGKVEKVIHIATDVTDLRRLQENLAQAQKMETIGRLAGGVAHDFNNILQTILGYSEMLLKDTPPNSPHHNDLTEIHRGGERAAELTRQLLAFSRRQMLLPRVLNLNDNISNLTKMLTRLLGEDVRLSFELAPGLPTVKADSGQMDQVLMNLAVNARDAMPQGGQIVIRTGQITLAETDLELHPEGRPGDFVYLAISDNGVGMSPEVQRQIFEPFFTTKGLGKGTGLGLATVYGIIKQHNGWITVYSEPGRGSTFKIYLPVATVEGEVAAPAPVVEALPRGHGESLLLIEDEPHVRRLAQQFLTQAGYRVVAAGTCAAAQAANDNLFDLVISDVVLPDGNGLDLAQRFQAQRPDLRCILISGYADIYQRWPEIAERKWAFLMKPFSQSLLLTTVAASLVRR